MGSFTFIIVALLGLGLSASGAILDFSHRIGAGLFSISAAEDALGSMIQKEISKKRLAAGVTLVDRTVDVLTDRAVAGRSVLKFALDIPSGTPVEPVVKLFEELDFGKNGLGCRYNRDTRSNSYEKDNDFLCDDLKQCVSFMDLCSGEPECDDGSDETTSAKCTTTTTTTETSTTSTTSYTNTSTTTTSSVTTRTTKYQWPKYDKEEIKYFSCGVHGLKDENSCKQFCMIEGTAELHDWEEFQNVENPQTTFLRTMPPGSAFGCACTMFNGVELFKCYTEFIEPEPVIEDKEEKDNSTVIVVIVVLFVIFAAAGGMFYAMSQKNKGQNTSASKKLAAIRARQQAGTGGGQQSSFSNPNFGGGGGGGGGGGYAANAGYAGPATGGMGQHTMGGMGGSSFSAASMGGLPAQPALDVQEVDLGGQPNTGTGYMDDSGSEEETGNYMETEHDAAVAAAAADDGNAAAAPEGADDEGGYLAVDAGDDDDEDDEGGAGDGGAGPDVPDDDDDDDDDDEGDDDDDDDDDDAE